jgi:hypothetical protein
MDRHARRVGDAASAPRRARLHRISEFRGPFRARREWIWRKHDPRRRRSARPGAPPVDPAKSRFRSYGLTECRTLFGELCLRIVWGRIGNRRRRELLWLPIPHACLRPPRRRSAPTERHHVGCFSSEASAIASAFVGRSSGRRARAGATLDQGSRAATGDAGFDAVCGGKRIPARA